MQLAMLQHVGLLMVCKGEDILAFHIILLLPLLLLKTFDSGTG